MMLYKICLLLYTTLITICQCDALIEPRIIELLNGQRYHFSFDYCPVTIYDNSTTNATLLLNYTALCFCQYNPAYFKSVNCSVPGPTFKFTPGTTVHMTWHNRVQGLSTSDESFLNEYKDISIFNMHSHGFHIDFIQDNVRVIIPPQTSYTYTYTIPQDHYPGFHMLHSHHHGSTSFHKSSGLFSAAIIEWEDNIASNIYDSNLWNMKQTILIMSAMYGVIASECDCSNEAIWTSFVTLLGTRSEVYSYCYEYCSFPESHRTASDFVYDMKSDIGNEFKLWLINGQFQPVIQDLVVNKWRRIRLLNAMSQFYMQVSLPLAACSWFLLAMDGIYLYENRPRDLSDAPYFGQFVLPPAGRADMAVMCTDEGIFEIITSQSNSLDSELNNLPRMDSDVLIFSLQINSQDSTLFSDIIGNDIINLPSEFPPKPRYLEDLTLFSDSEIGDCVCNSFDPTTLENDSPCSIEMRQTQGGTNHVINQLLFDPATPQQVLNFNNVYEFNLDLGSHIYHQHIYPFQLQENIGSGILGQNGDYLDTVGANNPFLIRVAFYDFAGPMIIHCHNLPHEDLGMMTWYEIVNDLNVSSCLDIDPNNRTPQPSFQPTIYFTTPKPTQIPTIDPTINPTSNPTNNPTIEPTSNPTNDPTQQPTQPTHSPTQSPTIHPTIQPTNDPTIEPTNNPTSNPTQTNYPTIIPTIIPTNNPTVFPTITTKDSIDENNSGGGAILDRITNNQQYESVFGIEGGNGLIIDVIGAIIIFVVIIILSVVAFCYWKRKQKYKQVEQAQNEGEKEEGNDVDTENENENEQLETVV